jgi:predicted transcriptional regulator
MSFTMDLGKDGLEMFFKPWQVMVLETFWDQNVELSSRDVWEAVGSTEISRASVINFLEAMHELSILDKNEVTGKGGYRGIYSSRYDEAGTKAFLKKLFRDRLDKL